MGIVNKKKRNAVSDFIEPNETLVVVSTGRLKKDGTFVQRPTIRVN